MTDFERWFAEYEECQMNFGASPSTGYEITLARLAFEAGLRIGKALGAQEEAEASGASRKTNYDQE